MENDRKESVSLSDDIFKLEWYYIDSAKKEPTGPISIRDLDVLIRTNLIDTNNYVWKEGMEDWKKIYQVNELKDIVNTTHTEMQESLIRSKIQASYCSGNNLKSENNLIENYYFGADGFWHVYNPISKVWTTQETKPIIRKKSYDFDGEDVKPEKSYGNIEQIKNLKSSFDENENPVENINENHTIDYTSITHSKEKNLSNETNQIILSTIADGQNKFIKKKRKFEVSSNNENIILPEEEIKILEKRKKKKEKRKEKKKHQWYSSRINSNIYVNYLPVDITEKELIEFFSRCGFIRKDPRTEEHKIKLYKDKQTGRYKGDALISYLREESVQLAVDLLNDSEIRPGHKIKVEKAKFEQKGDYQPREGYKMDDLQRFKFKTEIDRKLGWNEEDDEKGLKIIILKNMFELTDFLKDPTLRQDLELDIIEECEENFGEIEKFFIFEEHPDGIVKIKFHTPAAADKCLQALNGRIYNGRNIEAFYWDGKTDYSKSQEDQLTAVKRIEEFGDWLEK